MTFQRLLHHLGLCHKAQLGCTWKRLRNRSLKSIVPHVERWRGIKDPNLETNVPFIPAHIAPPGNLKNYYILFEVDQWKTTAVVRDPYLLQRLNDNTFVVLAEWDVSPVEAIIMRGV